MRTHRETVLSSLQAHQRSWALAIAKPAHHAIRVLRFDGMPSVILRVRFSKTSGAGSFVFCSPIRVWRVVANLVIGCSGKSRSAGAKLQHRAPHAGGLRLWRAVGSRRI